MAHFYSYADRDGLASVAAEVVREGVWIKSSGCGVRIYGEGNLPDVDVCNINGHMLAYEITWENGQRIVADEPVLDWGGN